MKARILVATVIFGVLALVADQYLKTHLTTTLSNPGSVLGLSIPNSLIIFLHIAVLAGGTIFIVTKVPETEWRMIGVLMLIVSLSNLADRLFLGAVVDYIYLLGIWFNLADAIITLGIVAIMYRLIHN